jgi:putative phosphoesterase
MRIGVISDTHIRDKSQALPQKMLEEFKHVDMIIHAGDLVDLSVLDKLKGLCAKVIAVRGNMDPEEVRKILPEKEIIEVGNYKIGLMHGHGAPANLMELLASAFKNDKVDVIIFGHSHSGINEKRGNVLFFNPGSLTDKMFAPYNSYGIIEINGEIKARIVKI